MKTKAYLMVCILFVSFTGKQKEIPQYSPGCCEDHDIKAKEITSVTSYQNVSNYDPPPDPEEILRQRNFSRSANLDWIKTSTRNFSPDSWHLLMQYDELPYHSEALSASDGIIYMHKTEETFHYLKGRTRIDLLRSMEKNIHEIAHAYFSHNAFRYITVNNLKMEPENAQGYIYLSPTAGFFVSFPLDAMFPSRELTKVIPEDMRTFRFDIYIEGTTSTQSEGTIGLLNELHAYFLGSRYCYDMLDPYKVATGSDSEGVFEWVTYTQSTMSAFYEFDYYLMEYLAYMKIRYPSDYEKLRLYSPFAEAYGHIRTSYKDLIDKYTDRIRSEMKLLNSSGGTTARMEKGWLWIKAKNSNVESGTPVFSDPREKLMPVLESRKYREIIADFNLR